MSSGSTMGGTTAVTSDSGTASGGSLVAGTGEGCEGDGARDSGGVLVGGGDGDGSGDPGGVPVCERGLDASACVSGLLGALGEVLIWVLIKCPHAFPTTSLRLPISSYTPKLSLKPS